MNSLIARLLADTCDVIGSVLDCADLPAAIERLQPDVVVVDLNMPKISGLEACRRIQAATPSVKVIILTADDGPEIRAAAFQAGAAGFVTKLRAADDLPAAIEAALRQDG